MSNPGLFLHMIAGYTVVSGMFKEYVAGIPYRSTGFKRLIFPYTALESIIISKVLQKILPCL